MTVKVTFVFSHCRIHNEGAGKMGPAGSTLLVLSTRFHALKLLPPVCRHVPLV